MKSWKIEQTNTCTWVHNSLVFIRMQSLNNFLTEMRKSKNFDALQS